MINLYDGLLSDLLHNQLAHDPEVQAIAYALRIEKRRLLDAAAYTRTLSAVRDLPDAILDALAADLRTPAYDETHSAEIKRDMIAGTLRYYQTLGTPAAVNWVVRTLFGNGGIQEWPDYGGTPYHFRVRVTNDGSFRTLTGLEEFIRLVNAVKRRSSWLDAIIVDTDLGSADLRFGGAYGCTVRLSVPEAVDDYVFPPHAARLGGAAGAVSRVALPQLRDRLTREHKMRLGGALGTTARYAIPGR